MITANSSGGTARTTRIFGKKNRALIGDSAANDCCDVFVLQARRRSRSRGFSSESAFPCLGKDARACRIVSAVDNDAAVPALKSRRAK